MTWLMAIVAGALFTGSIYLMLRRSMVKLIFGLVLLGHACNILIFITNDLIKFAAPIVPLGKDQLAAGAANSVPQALILTAIVISFAVQSYVAVLFKATYDQVESDDTDHMRSTDI
ncbi:MAG: NADH-quinone oxidoreductase subunit K [Oligoflexus sp.]